MKKNLTYSQSGVNYDLLDKLKRMAQSAGATLTFAEHFEGGGEGESAAIIKLRNDYIIAFVQEGLGTKNLVADAMLSITGKTYYDDIAQDTVAMIINDLITVGAKPICVSAYWAIGSEDWLKNEKRMKDLVNGWKKACELSSAGWIGGETPILSGVVNPKTVDLSGSSLGVIEPHTRLTLGEKLQAGDAVILFSSNGIHANGLTLARKLADQLPQGYETKLPSGKSYGESLLEPSTIYARLVKDMFDNNIDLHYMVHITGHGWRKLMRNKKDFSYRMTEVPPVPDVLKFVQEQAGFSDEEAYATFNMGAGFAIFVSQNDVEKVQKISNKHAIKSYNAGVVEKGPKQVIIEPKNIIFKADSLNLRA